MDSGSRWTGQLLFAEEEARGLSDGFQELKKEQLLIKGRHWVT